MSSKHFGGSIKSIRIGIVLSSISFIIFIASQRVTAEIISLPLFTIAISLGMSVLYIMSHQLPRYNKPIISPKIVDIIIFLFICLLVIFGYQSSVGPSDWYYPLAIITAGLLAYRILSGYTSNVVQLGQILLFALVLRSVPWFSAAIYGKDRFHQEAVGYLVTTGNIIPETVTYYANFPAAHILAATTTLISALPLKVGYFTLGIVEAISIVGVFILAKNIIRDDRGGLFGALFVSVAAYHLRAGAEPFAQTLFTALIPFIFYFIFKQNMDVREKILLIVLISCGVIVQNIAPLIILGVGGTIVLSKFVFAHVQRSSIELPIRLISIPYITIAIAGVIGIYYYIMADYLTAQTIRIYNIVLFFVVPSPSSEGVTSADSVGGAPNIEIFGLELPTLLMWAAPVLVIAGALIIVSVVLLIDIVDSKLKTKQTQYIIISGGIYSIFTIFFVSGSSAMRAMPSIAVLISPVIGWLAIRLQMEPDRQLGGHIIVISLIILVCTAGVLNPIVAKSEWGDDDPQPWLSQSQVTSIEFASDYDENAITGQYAARHERYNQLIRGNDNPSTSIDAVLKNDDTESIREFESRSGSGTTTVWMDYYKTVYSLEPPNTNKIYDVSSTSIYT